MMEPGKTERRFCVKFSAIFRSFSTHFPPMVPHSPFFRTHVYGLRLFLPISAYFPPIFCLFPPIFHLCSAYFPPVVPHPYYKLKHVTHLLIFHPHVYGFRLFSAHFPPKIPPTVLPGAAFSFLLQLT